MYPSRIRSQTIINAAAAPITSETVLVADYRHIMILALLVGATSTMKVKVSNVDGVDFTAASTVTNPWYYVDLVGLGDGGTTTTGSTGVATTTATTQKGYAVNVDLAKWLAVEFSALSAGTASVILSTATNE